MILTGPEYNINNGIVFDLLQSLAGPAWAWINNYERVRDGRNAWKALMAYYEGDSMQTRSKQQCYEEISQAVYKGYSRNFNFSSYVTIHQQAHQDLMRMGEPVPENKKVRDFLDGITNSQCVNIKFSVISNPIYMNDFLQMVNFCASTIDLTSKNTSDQWQISEFNCGNRGRG